MMDDIVYVAFWIRYIIENQNIAFIFKILRLKGKSVAGTEVVIFSFVLFVVGSGGMDVIT